MTMRLVRLEQPPCNTEQMTQESVKREEEPVTCRLLSNLLSACSVIYPAEHTFFLRLPAILLFRTEVMPELLTDDIDLIDDLLCKIHRH